MARMQRSMGECKAAPHKGGLSTKQNILDNGTWNKSTLKAYNYALPKPPRLWLPLRSEKFNTNDPTVPTTLISQKYFGAPIKQIPLNQKWTVLAKKGYTTDKVENFHQYI